MATSTGPAPIQPVRSGINLLDNWYFVGGGSQLGGGQFPINQRGNTTYTLSRAIDRWIVTYASDGGRGKVTVGENGLTYTNTAYQSEIYQRLPSALLHELAGKTVNLSVLAETGLASVAITLPNEIPTAATSFGNVYYGPNNRIRASILIKPDGTWYASIASTTYSMSILLFAAKLELGDTQTLAHQENGVWVLNDPPPNYDMELLKCQLSTVDSSDTYANKKIQFATT